VDNSLPRWAEVLGSDPVLRVDFSKWVEERCEMYAREGVVRSKDMGEVLGYRFLIGELEALLGMVSWNVEEGQRKQHAVSEVVPKRAKRNRRGKRDGGSE
jgi:hypothetical protein